MSNQPLRDEYDVIVVGGGIGGLTSGALLAKEGKQVLVVEKEEQPGGFAREFRYGPYSINPALHAIMGCNPSGPYGQGVISAILDHLEVQDQCDFVPFDPFYRVKLPDMQIDIPTGREAYLEAHLHHFPGEKAGLHRLTNLCSTIFQEFIQFPSVLGWKDWASMPFRYPNLFRYANSNLGKVTDRYLSDPKLKSVYAILYPYLALPPSSLSFTLWSVMMTSYIEQGAFYCMGGFQNLVNALTVAIRRHGSDLILESPVHQIQTSHGHVRGIVLENGQEINAPVVISNIDPLTTFEDLLEEEQVPSRYLRKLKKLEYSCSVLGIYLATDLDINSLGVPKVTLISSWDLEAAFEAANHKQVGGMAVHIPTVVDPSLAPDNEHVVVLQAFTPTVAADLSPADKTRFAISMLDKAETVLPELRRHITFIVGSTEGDHQEYPLHRLDSIYGWANSNNQSGPRRLPQKTPITGLYLAGHWTQPGSGIWTAVLSGINAARHVLGMNMSEAIWPINF